MRTNLWFLVLALAGAITLDLWTLVRDEIRLRQEERRASVRRQSFAPPLAPAQVATGA
jgi:hypothetical protein